MPFYWPSCSLTFCLLLFSLSLLIFCGLVLWGWGLRTDKVLSLSPSLALTTFFKNNNNSVVVFVLPSLPDRPRYSVGFGCRIRSAVTDP